METTTDTRTDTTVDTYLAAWNEPDPARRAELLAEAWTEGGHYVDPLLEATGHAALGELAEAVHGAYPGHRFVRTTQIDGHHSLVRFGWALVGTDGAVAVEGIDVAILADDGRLQSVGGFFGDLPDR